MQSVETKCALRLSAYEVPVMLTIVIIANKTTHWFPEKSVAGGMVRE